VAEAFSGVQLVSAYRLKIGCPSLAGRVNPSGLSLVHGSMPMVARMVAPKFFGLTGRSFTEAAVSSIAL